MNDIIESVVFAFYKKATTDFLIGYHFRKIASIENPDNPLKPPMEAFEHHLPRISSFWKNQLLGTPMPKEENPFDLITIHRELKIRRGELGRWILLFEETLNEVEMESSFKQKWKAKVDHFKNIFLNHPSLF